MIAQTFPGNRIPFLRNSSSHDLLLLAVSQTRAQGYLDVETAMYVLVKFTKPSMVRSTAERLVKLGLLEQVESDAWKITQLGATTLHQSADRIQMKDGRPTRYQV
jgi:hypothetical protein